MWSYFTWRCFSLSTRVVRVYVQLLLLLLAMFYFLTHTLSLSLFLSHSLSENNREIRVLLMCCYSVHRSLILSGYIVVVFDHRRTVNFRQDHIHMTYTYHCVDCSYRLRCRLSSLKSVNITDVIVAQAKNMMITSRAIFN
jgi:hypothetical protein